MVWKREWFTLMRLTPNRGLFNTVRNVLHSWRYDLAVHHGRMIKAVVVDVQTSQDIVYGQRWLRGMLCVSFGALYSPRVKCVFYNFVWLYPGLVTLWRILKSLRPWRIEQIFQSIRKLIVIQTRSSRQYWFLWKLTFLAWCFLYRVNLILICMLSRLLCMGCDGERRYLLMLAWWIRVFPQQQLFLLSH